MGEPEFPSVLRPHARSASYEAGATVFRAGAPARSVYFVQSGAIRLLRFGPAGEEVVLHEAGPNEFFAEASLDSVRYHCRAVAIAATELLQIDKTAFRGVLNADREFATKWLALLAARLRTARSRIERLSLRSAADRVQHYLVCEGRGPLCEVRIDGTLKDLARVLGLTHESLYRTISRLVREGVIERRDRILRMTR